MGSSVVITKRVCVCQDSVCNTFQYTERKNTAYTVEMFGHQSGVRIRKVLKMKQECQLLQYYLHCFQFIATYKFSGFESSDYSHFAVLGCDTVSSYRRSLAVACVRKIGICFSRLCVIIHVTTIFDSPLSSVPPPSNVKFRKL